MGLFSSIPDFLAELTFICTYKTALIVASIYTLATLHKDEFEVIMEQKIEDSDFTTHTTSQGAAQELSEEEMRAIKALQEEAMQYEMKAIDEEPVNEPMDAPQESTASS